MQSGNEKMQAAGWEIVNVTSNSGGWGCFNTLVLGCLFLPLALLGKRSDTYTVTYRIDENLYTENSLPNVNVKHPHDLSGTDNSLRDKQMAKLLGITALVIVFVYLLARLNIL